MKSLLTSDEAEHFSRWEVLFESGGWAQLVAELKAEADSIPTIAFTGVSSMEELNSYRGRLGTLLDIINKPDEVAARLQGIIQERGREAEPPDVPAEFDP